MAGNTILHVKPGGWGRLMLRTAHDWWYALHLGAIAMVMAMSPSTYNRKNWHTTAHYIHTYTWQVLPWFALVAALVSLVLIRIVVVTAYSYGLSGYALEMVVRVLILELIPLTAAVFVALRAGLAFNAGEALARATDDVEDSTMAQRRLQHDLVPQVIGNAFSVLSLAMVTSVIVLVLAYLAVYGFSPWGIDSYTRTVGRVFDPAVTIGFISKTFFFGMAVAIIPAAALLNAHRRGARRKSNVQPGAVGLLFVLLMIEAASLMIKYV
jgi:phospholipid/cholesterol/gamma-HCH transport system permease protein